MHAVKKNKQGSYSRDGVDIEVVADRDDTYDDLVEKACTALEMQKEREGCRISLFTSGGAVVIKSDGWTLGGYLKQTHRSSTQTRFGIGYVRVSSLLATVVCIMYM